MPLENLPPRLSPQQRDRAIELAARLQAEHGESIGVDELASAAEQVGIQPQFVHEAARIQMAEEQAALRAKDRRTAYALVGSLILINFAITFVPAVRTSLVSSAAGFALLALAGFSSSWCVKGRLSAWVGPSAILSTFAATQAIYVALRGTGYDGANSSTANLIGCEIAIALISAGLSWLIGFRRRPRTDP